VCIHHLELDVIDPECPYYHIGSSHYFHSSQKSKTVKPTLFLQLRLCIVNIVLQLGLIVLMWLQVRQRSNELNAEWFADISFIFPLIGVIFTWLAIRGIVKDITLLKSFDRIR